MEAYGDLAEAIVMQAISDYRVLIRTQRKMPNSRRMKRKVAAYEKFFGSEWFNLLCSLDSEYLMNELRKEVYPDDCQRAS